jgi:hypothetical protein
LTATATRKIDGTLQVQQVAILTVIEDIHHVMYGESERSSGCLPHHGHLFATLVGSDVYCCAKCVGANFLTIFGSSTDVVGQ